MTTTPAEPTVAIVGSGPAGCYTAQFLRKTWRDAEIVIFDRLDVPHGLVRYGVAPDHPGTKAIAKQFDRLFERDGVRFLGSTLVGSDPATSDVSLDELRAAFDVVVLASGLHADRPLGDPGIVLPGSQLPGVYGAGHLTRLINGHPDESAAGVTLGSRVAIIGHGNVAIDLLRLFLTAPDQLRGLGIADDVVAALSSGPVSTIDIIGRSLPAQAKFDLAMIRELSKLPDVRFEADGLGDVDPTGDPAALARQDAVATLIAGSEEDSRRRVRFHFGWEPDAITGVTAVEGITLRATDGSGRTRSLEVDSVCSAIGFTEHPDSVLRRADHESPGHVDLDRGILGEGLFCVGWLRRGPRGTIPENRVDARMVADTIVASTAGAAPSKRGLAGLSPRISPTETTELHHLIEELS